MLADDPEAPTTIHKRFNYGAAHRRAVTRLGARSTRARSCPSTRAARARLRAAGAVNAAAAPPRKQASNFLVVAPQRSATGNTLAVMGPQLGYYYPEIVQQIHLHGPGIKAQGVGVPGPGDVHPHRAHAELRLEPHVGQPRRPRRVRRAALQARRLGAHAGLDALPVQGQVPGAETFDAGPLDGKPLTYKTSVHGPVIGTATVGGKPYALSRKRSTFGRDGAQPRRAQGHDRGQGDHAEAVLRRRQPVRVHLQLGVRVAQGHGVLLVRPAARSAPAGSTGACRRSAPASTSGAASSSRAPAPARRQRARAACC